MDQERQSLETAVRASAWLLLLAGLLPFDFAGREPIWLWSGLADAGFFDGLALFSPLLGSGLAFWAGRRGWTKAGLSAAVLAGLLAAWAVAWWSERTPHPLGVFVHLTDGLPALFGRSFCLLVLGLVALAAGLRLGAREHLEPEQGRPSLADPWPLARGLTGAGIGAVVLFYLLPYRGAVPVVDLGAGILELLPLVGDMEGMALLSGQVLSIGPLLIGLAAIWRLFVRAPGHGGSLASLAVVFLPGLCLLVGLRNLPFMPAYTLIHLRSAALLVVVMVGGGLGLAALLRAVWYEVPWMFGRLTRTDDRLAAVLSEPDPNGSLQRALRELHPVARWFVQRRLALWRAAAAEVPGADAGDLGAVIRFLEQRWCEEQADRSVLRQERLDGLEAGESPAPAGSAPVSWPPLLRGHWLSLTTAGIVLGCGLISWWVTLRPDPGQAWPLGPDQEALEQVFSEQVPAVVLDLALPVGDFRDRLAYRQLRAGLERLEAELPGLTAALDELFDLGRKGRRRLHRIRRSRDRLNRLLRDRRVPYYVRSRVRAGAEADEDRFALLTYRIQTCRRYRPQGSRQAYAVLQLERADPLNLIETYMGMTEGEETFVTVFLDRLAYFMRERLGQVVRRPDAVGRIARQALAELGGAPEDLQAGIQRPLGRQLLEGLTRHELHHRWAGLDPEPPTALWAYLLGTSEESVRGVTAEVGAYLGELRYRPDYARLRLALMIDELESHAGRRGVHGRARSFLIERILGAGSGSQAGSTPWALSAASAALECLDDQALLDRIDSVHRDLFGLPAPVFEPLDPAPAAGRP